MDVAKPGAEFRVDVEVALAARPLGSEGTSEAADGDAIDISMLFARDAMDP